MKKPVALVLKAAFLALLIPSLAFAQAGTWGDPAKGARVFGNKGCIQCHALEGEGGKLAPSLDKMTRYASPLFVAQAMWNHGAEMDAKMKELGISRPQFTGREMVNLLAFIRAAAKPSKDKEYMPPGDPVKGQRIFNEKGCINCHSTDGKGKTIGPDLGRIEFLGSATELAGVMWNHGPEMWAQMKEKKRPRPVFQGREMADLIAYLYFLNFSDKPGNAAIGEKLFVAKGCASCHSVPGKAPDIAKITGQISSIRMAQLMWNHAPKMATVMQQGKIPWPEFKGKELPDLLAYLTVIREKK